MEEHYNLYLFHCINEGETWNMKYRPYTYTEWIDNNCPEHGGVKIEKIFE